jgi:hypothetical protein
MTRVVDQIGKWQSKTALKSRIRNPQSLMLSPSGMDDWKSRFALQDKQRYSVGMCPHKPVC